ncbi:unnamed protein product, partial [Polarella glacialis]
ALLSFRVRGPRSRRCDGRQSVGRPGAEATAGRPVVAGGPSFGFCDLPGGQLRFPGYSFEMLILFCSSRLGLSTRAALLCLLWFGQLRLAGRAGLPVPPPGTGFAKPAATQR